MLDDLRIRRYRDTDARVTRSIFERAVRVTAAAHYAAEQLAAWVPDDPLGTVLDDWAARRAAVTTWVAELDDSVVGFTDLDVETGYLDMLFVDPDAGRRGVGSALISQVLDEARAVGLREVTVQASRTAQPVFERHGFVVVREQRVERRGVLIENAVMRMPLDASAG
ncbi:GNAT family N-acetyltransferase [Plantibacter cousiniae (nom. nud.)]|uniref:Acetyltransferase, GNAT family n=1 Tax=Plantibacter cousiniae (nom. nud.) TaxID=199709 RepID=A0ABY1LPB2_9MICO|nr:GNAT family N-acetyltransferase [Plantibacter cousiniae]SKC70276.1 Acetyltransferase, GNAT family [Plantibacter cousiniae]